VEVTRNTVGRNQEVPLSPTPPSFVALNDRLNKAHRRIRELESGEAELLAQISTLRAVVTELTHGVRAPATRPTHVKAGADFVA
jgi:hypothetical protein